MSTVSNVDQFRQSFREEAKEILVELESALLELNENRGDLEIVGRVFRALHTIKGSGSMFGFDDLAQFTHNLENAYDEVRNGRLDVSSELIDLTLSALDQIRMMLNESTEGALSQDEETCAEILTRVRHLTAKSAEKPATEPEAKSSAPRSESELETTADDQALREHWIIHFAPGQDMLRNGANPLMLLEELRALGNLSLEASMASIPPLDEMDPERCYISWQINLETAAGPDAIRDVFIFVEDSCELTIDHLSQSETAATTKAPVVESTIKAKLLEEPRATSGGRRSYDQPDTATSLRVPAAKLDQFVDLVGELVTVQARLSQMAGKSGDFEVVSIAEEIERLTSSLRENSMNIRMLPIRATFEKFRRLVHDLARSLGKNVELTIEGAATELDKTVIDQLSDPLMHLIRNSMDHGIEVPEVRKARGKRAVATIHLFARHSGASVLIGVSDDGGGINAEAVRARAVERGLISHETQLSEAGTNALIFEPGFSTAKSVTDVSGRGVGMDVVRQRVESLRGSIDVTSKASEGTCVTLRLPLTLAIIDGLLVSVGSDFFVLPLANTLECIELSGADIERANGKHVVNVRGEIISYIRLREYFNICGPRPDLEQIMVVETEGGRYGFVVDEVLGDCQTVIKNLGRFYRHVQVVSGATILGNGSVALILDPERLVQCALRITRAGERRSAVLTGRSQPRVEIPVNAEKNCVGAVFSASACP